MENHQELTDFLQNHIETATVKKAIKETIESHRFEEEDIEIITLKDVLEMYKWFKMSQLNQIKQDIEKNLIDERDQLIAKHLEITSKQNDSVKQCGDMQEAIENCRQDLVELIRTKNCGPILIRLSWHDAGTYDARDNSGGPQACMRFPMGEIDHAANAGLKIAID